MRQWQPLSAFRRFGANLNRSEFEKAVKQLKNAKATGPDKVPAEVYKYCPEVKEELFKFLEFIWNHECIPENLVCGRFVMLWKRKGSTNDPSKYRCICLLNHAYKILANILLTRLVAGSTGFLLDWQAGFRVNRGCRDNTMALRTLCDEMLLLGKSLAITFIDYAAAFDSVSHKFIDAALTSAGVGNKERAIFREVYKSASAFTTVNSTDGGNVQSSSFQIRRGVVQGDVTSPLYFILALELILRRHDSLPDKGVPMAHTMVHTLGYAG